MPKISVIIVTYNRLAYLKLAVASVLNQTFKDFELVIVADGHQQDVKEYVDAFENPAITYKHTSHCGYPAKGRNLGITSTTAPYIAFCDDDDIWEPGKLEKQWNVFLNNANISLCCTNRKFIDSNGSECKNGNFTWFAVKNSLQNLLISNYVCYSSVLLKRTILDKTDLFPDDIKFKASEDFHLWLRVAYHGEIFFLNEKLVLYRIHNGNISTRISIGIKRTILVYEDIFKMYPFRLIDKLKAYSVAYVKLTFYTLNGN